MIFVELAQAYLARMKKKYAVSSNISSDKFLFPITLSHISSVKNAQDLRFILNYSIIKNHLENTVAPHWMVIEKQNYLKKKPHAIYSFFPITNNRHCHLKIHRSFG